MGFGIAPAFDDDVGESGPVLGTDDGEEGVQGHGVLESKCVAGVEDGLGLGIDGLVEKENVGHEGGYCDSRGDAW